MSTKKYHFPFIISWNAIDMQYFASVSQQSVLVHLMKFSKDIFFPQVSTSDSRYKVCVISDGCHDISEVASFLRGHQQRSWKHHSREILSFGKISKHKTFTAVTLVWCSLSVHVAFLKTCNASIWVLWTCFHHLGTFKFQMDLLLSSGDFFLFFFLHPLKHPYLIDAIYRNMGRCIWSLNEWSYFATQLSTRKYKDENKRLKWLNCSVSLYEFTGVNLNARCKYFPILEQVLWLDFFLNFFQFSQSLTILCYL